MNLCSLFPVFHSITKTNPDKDSPLSGQVYQSFLFYIIIQFQPLIKLIIVFALDFVSFHAFFRDSNGFFV